MTKPEFWHPCPRCGTPAFGPLDEDASCEACIDLSDVEVDVAKAERKQRVLEEEARLGVDAPIELAEALADLPREDADDMARQYLEADEESKRDIEAFHLSDGVAKVREAAAKDGEGAEIPTPKQLREWLDAGSGS